LARLPQPKASTALGPPSPGSPVARAAAEILRRARIDRGLPLQIEDPAAYARIAAILRAHFEECGR
jgi:hypothetical protein